MARKISQIPVVYTDLKSLRNRKCKGCGVHEIADRVCVMGKGPKRAKVMIVDETHRDPSDRVYRALWKMLNEVGIQREDVFVASAIACRTESFRKPKAAELKACSEFLQAQISLVKPKYILLLGAGALKSALGLTGIKKLRGRPKKVGDVIYLPTISPGALLRSAKEEPALRSDLRMFAECIRQGKIPKNKGIKYTIVQTKSQLRRMLAAMKGIVSFDIETTGLYPWASGARIVSIGFGTKGKQWCIPFYHPGSKWKPAQLPWLVKQINRVIGKVKLVAQFGKFDTVWMRQHFGVKWELSYDTGLAHHLIDENSYHGLDFLAQSFYGALNYDVPLEIKTGQAGTLKEHCRYLASDLYYTRRLRFTLNKLLRQDGALYKLYRKLVMRVNHLYADAEFTGFYIDRVQFQKAEKHLKTQIAKSLVALNKIVTDSGYVKADKKTGKPILDKQGNPDPINWGSPQQISAFVYGHLKLPIYTHTKTGGSTDNANLIRMKHPIAKALIDYRKSKQQLSFFIDGWKPYLTPEGYIHPHFKIHGTVTGRPSCENPNLQQVPKDPFIRSLITAPLGWELVEVDLSQAELRIAAELSGDPTLMGIFLNDKDAHWATALAEVARGAGYPQEVRRTARKLTGKKYSYANAIQVLLDAGPDACVAIDKFWKGVRDNAKPVNFGYLYGMWWKKFRAYALEKYGVTVTDAQAQASREAFFELYSSLPAWHDKQRRYSQRHGYVRSLSGRKRRLPAAMSFERSFDRDEAQRQAINSPVQAFAAELNLMAAVQLRDEYSDKDVRIVGTVHDSVLFMVRESKVKEVVPRMVQIMEKPALLEELGIKLQVPMKADASIGPWSKGLPLDKWISQYHTQKSNSISNAGKRTTIAMSRN